MLELLYKLIIGHNHKWKILSKKEFKDSKGIYQGCEHCLQCEICGKLEVKRDLI